MGCFFACFRIKTGPRSPLSSLETTPCKRRDHTFAKNQLASLLLSEDDDDLYEFDIGRDDANRGLKHEAKLLKACGVLLQTPAEIKKGPSRTDFQTHEEDDQPDTSAKKLQYDEQPNQISNSPTFAPDDSSPRNTQRKCMSVGEQTCISVTHSIEPRCAVAQKGNESPFSNVIEGGGGQESSSAAPASKHSSPQSGKQVHVHVSKDSPYPTPLKLTDGMETPGTFYPTTLGTRGYGKINRIRSQYVFAIQNHVKDPSDRKGMNEGLPCSAQPFKFSQQQVERCSSSDHGLEQLHSPTSPDADSGLSRSNPPLTCTDVKIFSVDAVSCKPTADSLNDSHSLSDSHSGGVKQGDLSPGSTTPMVPSLSQWLKPRNPDDERAMKQNSPVSKSPETDRPIIGIVAAHWNDEESTRLSPKMWDGKGIPNSTNKYKEDQRVSWHATPFEERLEKALSDEKLFPPRKLLNGKPIEFDEEDEVSDTAAS